MFCCGNPLVLFVSGEMNDCATNQIEKGNNEIIQLRLPMTIRLRHISKLLQGQSVEIVTHIFRFQRLRPSFAFEVHTRHLIA
jgi:hypothetical protein